MPSREVSPRLLRFPAALFVVAAVVLGALPVAAASTPAAVRPPEIHLSANVLTPGETVRVDGTHWPQGTLLQASLCGANAVNGSADCAETGAITMAPGPDGALGGNLRVLTPPVPCPCVVFVISLTAKYEKRIPVEVVGAASAPIEKKSPRAGLPTLEVKATVSGGTTLISVVGGPADRTLVVTVRNSGTRAVENSIVAARWGRKGSPDHAIPARSAGRIPAGRSRTVSMKFQLDPLSYGSYTVVGTATGGAEPARFHASTSTWPWGLVIVVLLLIQLVLLAFRNRARRRMAAKELTTETAAAT